MGVPPRFLVTGAGGFVGAAVVRLAVARGLRSSPPSARSSQLDRLAPVARDVTVVRADITDDAAFAAPSPPRVPTHACTSRLRAPSCARTTSIAAGRQHPAPARLARTLADAGCARLVTAGSSSEYGTVDGPMDEAAACEPDDPYGVAKLAGGLLVRVVARQHGLESAHLRLFSVYGPGEDPRWLVPSVVRALLAGRPVQLTPGDQARDFVYVDDVAEALLAARCFRHRRPDGQRRHRRPDDDPRPLPEARRPHRRPRAAALRRPPYRAASASPGGRRPSTPRAALDWRARTSLDEGLRHTVAHERDLGSWRREHHGAGL